MVLTLLTGYTKKNVKKMPKAKPGMVIYTNYKTVNVIPTKI